MTWTITREKPLAGVSKDGEGRVVIDLSEAFDAPPTFEQVARYVGLSPDELLDDLLSEIDDMVLMGTRILAMRVIAHSLDPNEFAENRARIDESPSFLRNYILGFVGRDRREDVYARDDTKPNRHTLRYPLWLVPTADSGQSVVIPAPLTASTSNLISLRSDHWEDIHDYLEANHEDFVALREESERLFIASREFIATTRRLKEEAGSIIQPMNDLAVMISNMLAHTASPADQHAHAEAREKSRRVAGEVAADLHLGVSLVAEHFFASEDHPLAKKRADKFRIIKHSLDTFPGEAASKLVMLDDLAPPDVVFEYFRAMEACAAALSMADPNQAGPLLEKHFMHLLVSVAGPVAPIDASGLDGAKKAVAEAANSFDMAVLARLDKKGDFPAVPVVLPSTDPAEEGARLLKWMGAPASIVGTISNYALIAVEASTFGDGSGSAMLTRLALGVAGDKLAQREAALLAMLERAAGEHIDDADALEKVLRKEARSKVKAATESAKEKISISNDGVLAGMSTVAFFLDLTSMLTAFYEIRRENESGGDSWDSEDWLKGAQAVHSAAGSTASLIGSIDTLAARSSIGAGQAIAGQGIGRLAEWAKVADEKVLPVLEVALGLWAARESQLKAIRWGHESDAGFEVFALVVGLIKYVHPLAGFVATAVLGVIRALKKIDGGSNGMHKYYEHQKEQIVAQLQSIKGMDAVAKRWEERFRATSPTENRHEIYEAWHKVLDVRNVKDRSLTRLDRLYALNYQLNEWMGAMLPVSMPPFAVSDKAFVKNVLKKQGFPSAVIDLVLKN